MFKTAIKIIDVAGGVYLLLCAANAVYEMGKEAGIKEAAESNQDGVSEDNNDNVINIDGVCYKRVAL